MTPPYSGVSPVDVDEGGTVVEETGGAAVLVAGLVAEDMGTMGEAGVNIVVVGAEELGGAAVVVLVELHPVMIIARINKVTRGTSNLFIFRQPPLFKSQNDCLSYKNKDRTRFKNEES
jgi:hypothetical protein